VVFDQLGVHLNQIAEDDSYREVITRLILWVEDEGQTANLIAAVRQANAGNLRLRDFENQYKQRRPLILLLSKKVVEPEIRRVLVDILAGLPVSESFKGRSVFLSGIPGNLNRSEENARLDLDKIIEQLDGLGRTNTGSWPLVLLIDNALPYAEGYSRPTAILQAVRSNLLQLYGDI